MTLALIIVLSLLGGLLFLMWWTAQKPPRRPSSSWRRTAHQRPKDDPTLWTLHPECDCCWCENIRQSVEIEKRPKEGPYR